MSVSAEEARAMVYEKSVIFKGDYVEVHSTGEKNLQSSVSLWQEITKVCMENDCFKVLGIAESTKPMPIMDSVKHQNLFEQFSVTHKYKIAWVELNQDAVENTKFLENFLLNRGLINGRLFATVEEARAWLLEN